MKTLPPVSSVLWSQRYEALRRHVVEQPQVLISAPLGLIVVFTRGLAGWMQSWWEAPSELSTSMVLPQPHRCLSTPQWQQQLTGLLAHMTAQHL
jgi:hypothetical protein